MNIKKAHYISGIIITVFILLHLANHSLSFWGAERHIAVMELLRNGYRNVFAETLLLAAIFFQVISGIRLFLKKRKSAKLVFEKLQLWSGLYLVIFFVIHLSAVMAGRLVLNLDTNFYFGAAGINTFPFNLFFIPYYALAIMSFTIHLAAVHRRKMKRKICGAGAVAQSVIIVCCGLALTLFIFYGLTSHFNGVRIPAAYKVLVGEPAAY